MIKQDSKRLVIYKGICNEGLVQQTWSAEIPQQHIRKLGGFHMRSRGPVPPLNRGKRRLWVRKYVAETNAPTSCLSPTMSLTRPKAGTNQHLVLTHQDQT